MKAWKSFWKHAHAHTVGQRCVNSVQRIPDSWGGETQNVYFSSISRPPVWLTPSFFYHPGWSGWNTQTICAAAAASFTRVSVLTRSSSEWPAFGRWPHRWDLEFGPSISAAVADGPPHYPIKVSSTGEQVCQRRSLYDLSLQEPMVNE